jgi:hypothetical protein
MKVWLDSWKKVCGKVKEFDGKNNENLKEFGKKMEWVDFVYRELSEKSLEGELKTGFQDFNEKLNEYFELYRKLVIKLSREENFWREFNIDWRNQVLQVLPNLDAKNLELKKGKVSLVFICGRQAKADRERGAETAGKAGGKNLWNVRREIF